ncbi:MAG: integrin alpha [Planctomycetota bacterium]
MTTLNLNTHTRPLRFGRVAAFAAFGIALSHSVIAQAPRTDIGTIVGLPGSNLGAAMQVIPTPGTAADLVMIGSPGITGGVVGRVQLYGATSATMPFFPGPAVFAPTAGTAFGASLAFDASRNGVVGSPASSPTDPMGVILRNAGGLENYTPFAMSGGLSVDGDSAGDQLGFSVAVGDFLDNGGALDYLAGMPGTALPGEVRLYDASGTATVVPDPVMSGPAGFGTSVARIGDVDQDGNDDFIVGHPVALGGSGHAYVYSGRTQDLLTTLSGGFSFGSNVGIVGNVDGDGVPEFFVSEPGLGFGLGQIVIYRGASLTQHSAVVGTTFNFMGLPGIGTAVAGEYDYNNDGRDDIVFGEPGAALLATVYDVAHGAVLLAIPRPTGNTAPVTSIAFANVDAETMVGDPEGPYGAQKEIVVGQGDAMAGAGTVSVYSTGRLGLDYCSPAVPNSTARPAKLAALVGPGPSFGTFGIPVLLTCSDLPPSVNTFFLSGMTVRFDPAFLGIGALCVGDLVMLPPAPIDSGAMGFVSLPVTVSVPVGTTVYYQVYYEDVDPITSAPANNFSNALSITF